MKSVFFALKKSLRAPVYLLFLLLILTVPPLFYALGRESSMPRGGFAIEDNQDPEAARMGAFLREADLVEMPDRDSLYEAVARGEIDAGTVIPGDLSLRLARGEYQACLEFISAPDSAFPDLWKEEAVSALLAVYTPYIAASLLEAEGVDPALVFEDYWARMDKGMLFHFEITEADGAAPEEGARSRRFFLFAISMLLFLASWFALAAPAGESYRMMKERIGRKQALRNLFLPLLGVRALGLWLACGAACALSGCHQWGRLSVYWLALLLLSALLALSPGQSWKTILIYLMALLSLALMPLFADLSLLVPLLSGLRKLLPPLWPFLLAGLL